MSRPPTRAGRRAVVVWGVTGGLGALLLSACDERRSDGPAPPSAMPVLAESPDLPLAVAASTEVAALLSLVRRATRADPALAQGPLQGFAAMHRRHLARLSTDPDAPSHPRLPGSLQRRATFVRGREQDGVARLAHLAGRAESGALAGLFAQISAAAAARLVATSHQGAGPAHGASTLPGTDPRAPSTSSRLPSTQVSALQVVLAREHAALFLYGVLGAHTSLSRSPDLYAAVTDAYDTHRDRRDQLAEAIASAGADPVAAEPGYVLPGGLDVPTGVAREGLRLERECAAAYLWLVEQSTREPRAWAVSSLQNTAARALSFRGSPEIFPGAL